MKRLLQTCSIAALLGLLTVASGCASIVGDDCTNDSDCGSGLLCDGSLPDGYCTRPECDSEGCPTPGMCVTFDDETSYCMKPCTAGDDCRPGYQCVADFGPHPFCAVPSTAAPGS